MPNILYVCSACQATDCKLWRESNTIGPRMFCAYCSGIRQKADIYGIDQTGKHNIFDRLGLRSTDQIGSYFPAVPDKEFEYFYGYTSVPDDRVFWWYDLPSYPSHR